MKPLLDSSGNRLRRDCQGDGDGCHNFTKEFGFRWRLLALRGRSADGTSALPGGCRPAIMVLELVASAYDGKAANGESLWRPGIGVCRGWWRLSLKGESGDSRSIIG